MKGAELLG